MFPNIFFVLISLFRLTLLSARTIFTRKNHITLNMRLNNFANLRKIVQLKFGHFNIIHYFCSDIIKKDDRIKTIVYLQSET